MELYDLISPKESMLAAKADLLRIPLGGTMELTPLCNMNCKMCYIRQDPAEMEKQGRLLSCNEWLRIAEEAKRSGVLYLLLTGGEPLVFPEFRHLYTVLSEMGFILTINTNGTLIDEEWADFFASRPCRRLNITLYAKDDAGYDRLCGNSRGHTQLMRAFQLLRERDIPFRINFTVTPDNADQLSYACALSRELGVPLESAHYLFPPNKRESCTFSRLSPEEVVRTRFEKAVCLYGEEAMRQSAKNTLANRNRRVIPEDYEGLTCRAGRSGFWMAWNGALLPCGFFKTPKMSLLEHSFEECWKYIVSETTKLKMYSGCRTCENRNLCHVCGAACICETGSTDGKPDYICQTTEAYFRKLQEYAE